MKKVLIFVSALALCSAGVFLFGSYAFHLPGLYRMARHPMATQGSITGKTPENHHHVTYRFVVASKAYDSESAIGDAYESIAIDATVPIIYDPTDPDVSRIYDPAHPGQWHLASPDDGFFSVLLILSVFSLIGGLLFTFSLSRVAKRRGLI